MCIRDRPYSDRMQKNHLYSVFFAPRGNVRMAEKDVAARLADALKERTGIPTRHTVLGYLQRAGAPSVFDRILGTRLGYKAAECVVRCV